MTTKSIIWLFFLSLTYCKTTSKTEPTQIIEPQKISGIVTYNYSEQGCKHLIIAATESDSLFLIPIPSLIPEEFPEGTKVYFNYTLSRRVQPRDCLKGKPAIVKNIETARK